MNISKMKLARMMKRYTQDDVANMTGLSKGLIQEIESGRKSPKKVLYINLEKIANVLEISIDDIVNSVEVDENVIFKQNGRVYKHGK